MVMEEEEDKDKCSQKHIKLLTTQDTAMQLPSQQI